MGVFFRVILCSLMLFNIGVCPDVDCGVSLLGHRPPLQTHRQRHPVAQRHGGEGPPKGECGCRSRFRRGRLFLRDFSLKTETAKWTCLGMGGGGVWSTSRVLQTSESKNGTAGDLTLEIVDPCNVKDVPSHLSVLSIFWACLMTSPPSSVSQQNK